MRTLDAASLERSGHNDAIEAAIRNYELAFRMQTAVPELMDVSRESQGDAGAVRHVRPVRANARATPTSASSPGGWSSGACGLSS